MTSSTTSGTPLTSAKAISSTATWASGNDPNLFSGRPEFYQITLFELKEISSNNHYYAMRQEIITLSDFVQLKKKKSIKVKTLGHY